MTHLTTMPDMLRPVPPGMQPDNHSPDYGSARLRHPQIAAVHIPQTSTELRGPGFTPAMFPPCADLTTCLGGAELLAKPALTAV